MTCDWLLIIASCVCISFNLSKVPKNCLHYANAQKTAEQGHPPEENFSEFIHCDQPQPDPLPDYDESCGGALFSFISGQSPCSLCLCG
jgi:hypothetical protein